jgi:hypothetical protein
MPVGLPLKFIGQILSGNNLVSCGEILEQMFDNYINALECSTQLNAVKLHIL